MAAAARRKCEEHGCNWDALRRWCICLAVVGRSGGGVAMVVEVVGSTAEGWMMRVEETAPPPRDGKGMRMGEGDECKVSESWKRRW